MIRTGAFLILLCSAILVNALDISLKGTIKKEGGTPLAGASVTTIYFDQIKDTTDSLGKFSLTATGLSTKHQNEFHATSHYFVIKNNAIIFLPLLGSLSGKIDIYSADGRKYISVPFTDLTAGREGVTLPRLMPGINVMRLDINGAAFIQTLLSVGNAVYSQSGLSNIRRADNSPTAKKAAIVDTLLVYKTEFIDVKTPLDSYTKQDIVDSMSGGVLRKLFQISDSMIPDWKMYYSTVDSSFTLWSASDLWQDIDGGFEVYTRRGMLQAADIGMRGPINAEGDTNMLTMNSSFIMDFGNESNAKVMYDFQKSQYFDPDSILIPGFADTIAFAKSSLGGVMAYAYYKQFYFQFGLIGFMETNEALAATKMFLDYFKSKAE